MFEHPKPLKRSRERSLRTGAIGVAGLLQPFDRPLAGFFSARCVNLRAMFGGIG